MSHGSATLGTACELSCLTNPSLALLLESHPEFPVTAETIQGYWKAHENKSPFKDYLFDIVWDSPKINWLKDHI